MPASGGSKAPKSECLSPHQRIKKRWIFQQIFQKGRFAKGRHLNLWACELRDVPEEKMEGPALGIIVSKKTNLRATVRNVWRRRIRESFRRHQALMKEDVVIVIQSRRQIKVPSYDEIWTDIQQLLKTTGSLRP